MITRLETVALFSAPVVLIGAMIVLGAGTSDRAVAILESREIVDAVVGTAPDQFCTADGEPTATLHKPNCADYYWRGSANYRIVHAEETRIFSLRDAFDAPKLIGAISADGRARLEKTTERDVLDFATYVSARELYQRPRKD